MYYHLCLASTVSGCNKFITWNFAICAECEKTYGNRAGQWPSWLRFLWREEQKSRRRNKKQAANEICFTDLDLSLETQ